MQYCFLTTAGDQVAHSPDDQKCGDHYIEKGLECHDGDAHRPTPGKNPYWQGGRKGPDDESKSQKGRKGSGSDLGEEGKGHKRERSERTERSRKYGKDVSKEEQIKDAVSSFDHYADMMEKAWKNEGKEVEWTPTRKKELIELVMRDMAVKHSLSADELGFLDKAAEHYGPIDNYLALRNKGYKGRSMSRPRRGDFPGTMTDDQGNPVYLPNPHPSKEGLFHETEKRTRGPKRDKSISSNLNWKVASASFNLAPSLNWSLGKIMSHRLADQLREYEDFDMAQGRPCGEGEEPEEGHCNPNLPPPRPREKNVTQQPPLRERLISPETDKIKTLRDRDANPRKEGVSVGPKPSQKRVTEVAPHVSNLNRAAGDPARVGWSMSKIFPGSISRRTKKGGYGGQVSAPSPEEATKRDANARTALEEAGWTNTSDMGGRSAWSKSGVNVLLGVGKGKDGKAYNRFVTSPMRRAHASLVASLNWATGRECGENESYPEKCDDGGGGSYEPDWEDSGYTIMDPNEGYDLSDEPDEDWDPQRWEEELAKDEFVQKPEQEAVSPEEVAPPAQPEKVKKGKGKGKRGEFAERRPRDPDLGPNDFHQYWQSDAPHIQEALEKYVLPRLKDPEKAEETRDLLMNGPKFGNYKRKGLNDVLF